jgi:hypothetical protein
MEQDKSTRVIACARCQLEVSVTTEDGGLTLAYDIAHWTKRCCCSDRSSPTDCCSFLTLESVVNSLPRAPKGPG